MLRIHTNVNLAMMEVKFDHGKGKHSADLARHASVQRALSILEMEVEQINKGNYERYMQKEIHEQPESLNNNNVFPVTMEVASDLLDRQGPIYREDTTVFVSQSGETVDTLHALENGALCIGITNTVGSAIARSTHFGVHINAGVEIDVASTKCRILSLSHFLCQQAYTSQIVVMPMLALAIGGNTISSQARKKAIIDGLFELPSKVRKVLKLDQEMKDLAKLLIAEQLLIVFGRGYNYATALERALKVKDMALMHSEGILACEMKHGPLALVDEYLPIVVIATRDACFNKQQSVIQQLHSRKGRLVVMRLKGDAASVSVGGSCRIIEVPQVEDCLQPIINVVPLQTYLTVPVSCGFCCIDITVPYLHLCFLSFFTSLGLHYMDLGTSVGCRYVSRGRT
ncbi:hypothetical protein ACSBR2_017564 [Camellia fascicularis]